MFNQDFYPTPVEVIELMNLKISDKIILEPHAGSGNMLDYFQLKNAKEVLCCELDPKLSQIAKAKGRFLKSDFFDVTSEEVSHIDAIYMNPPFRNAQKHILHAWNIAPQGCEIVSLCNYTLIQNLFSRERNELASIIQTNGEHDFLGDCFISSERKTGIEVGIIKLKKPKTSTDTDYSEFFSMDEEEFLSAENGILKHDFVRATVNTYIGAMKAFDLLKEQQNALNYSLKMMGISEVRMEIFGDTTVTLYEKEHFLKVVQKQAWKYIFSKVDIEKYLTTNVLEEVNRFVETQTKIPFTVKNIYKMLAIIAGTADQNFDKAIIEAIEHYTKHTHENRHHVEGWKTNSGYMLNKRFIINYISKVKDYGDYKGRVEVDSWGSNFKRLLDLNKVICRLTGTDFNSLEKITQASCTRNEKGELLTTKGRFVNSEEKMEYSEYLKFHNAFEAGTWYNWGFFKVKFFKKGTMHLEFLDEKVWHKVNSAYGKLKGFVLYEK